MEPALKQRLIGGAVLVALAVIFLPMLIKGPATESGAADVSLTMPDAPRDGMTTRTIPLGAPGDAGAGGAVGLQSDADTLPTVDTAASSPGAMLPAATAGGNYAVTFGNWATPADADRVISALRAEQLVAFRQAGLHRNGQPVQRVRIGPFASEAEAEAARIRAGRVRGDLGAKVIVLDTGAVPMADPGTASAGTVAPSDPIPVVPAPSTSTSTSTPAPLASATPPKAAPLPAATPAPRPATPPAAAPPVASAPIPAPVAPKPPAPAPAPRPAAGNVGFAVQLGAFSNADEANKLRDRLRAAGFNAFVEGVRSDKGLLSRVRVGPVATRAEADALKSQVAGRAGVSGDVRAHP